MKGFQVNQETPQTGLPGRSAGGGLAIGRLVRSLILAGGLWLGAETALAQTTPNPEIAVATEVSLENVDQTFDYLLTFPAWATLNTDFADQIDLSSVVGDDTVSPTRMTLPSLWWNRDYLTPRLGGNRLVQSWLAYHIKATGLAVVDVSINGQIWGVLKYGERFAALSQFAVAAQNYNYNLRFLQPSNAYNSRIIGMYVCEFPDRTAALKPPSSPCRATIDPDFITRRQLALAETDSP